MNRRAKIPIPKVRLAKFCQKRHIVKMGLFGSILRDDFGPKSDVDVLVEFEPAHVPGLFGLAEMELELSKIMGRRKVDLNTPGFFGPDLRRQIVDDAEIVYAQIG